MIDWSLFKNQARLDAREQIQRQLDGQRRIVASCKRAIAEAEEKMAYREKRIAELEVWLREAHRHAAARGEQ